MRYTHYLSRWLSNDCFRILLIKERYAITVAQHSLVRLTFYSQSIDFALIISRIFFALIMPHSQLSSGDL